MCGIAGIIGKGVKEEQIKKMLALLSHRGPEDEGIWVSKNNAVQLGQRRLAIIDLSQLGHQPMVTDDGRYAITFNGEIYNYQVIKEELLNLGWKFKSQSDTEVLLYAFIQWQEQCLEKLNGMFSFAVWDEKEQVLFAARDRLGEKPFKYYHSNTTFIFASEIKALLSVPEIPRNVDWQAIDMALSFRFVGSPMTGFTEIKKLPAGHYLVWKNNEVTVKKYWNLPEQPKLRNFNEAKESLWPLFTDAVSKRMLSDVPLGAFLSGGIDSTSVVAAMSELSAKPIETFVISMNGVSEDQTYARIAANYFKTNHHEIALTDINYDEIINQLGSAYDEPFFDQSALPSLLISKHIKPHVTVVLSGDGGDELFGGYSNYAFARFLKRYNALPSFIRKTVQAASSFTEQGRYYHDILSKNIFGAYSEYFSTWKTNLPNKKYLTKNDLYLPEIKKVVDNEFCAKKMQQWFGSYVDVVNGAMAADIRGRLADGYMTKIDVATMQYALETRPPFLDHRLVELSQRIPSEWKIKGTKQKYIWHEVVKNKLPPEILNRKKVGFAVPLGDMLVDKLKPMVENALLSKQSQLSHYFSRKVMEQLWDDHRNKRADYSNHIWSLLILDLWLHHYQPSTSLK